MIRIIVSSLIAPFLLVFSIICKANEGTVAFVGATIIDGTDAAPLENGVLVITDGRIRTVGPRSDVTLPQGADVIDVSGKYNMLDTVLRLLIVWVVILDKGFDFAMSNSIVT